VWAEGGQTLYKLIQLAKGALRTPYLGDTFESAELCSAIQKLELFRELAIKAPDSWLREGILMRSESAELWFTQKTNFARSSAVMSIVGYLIGLGDRHPCNILFMKNSGNVVHIDFSDCFDKARCRTHVPEQVPFRLTRMMIKALGISGVEGVFKMTANFVMNLMRRNQTSLLAFLDIFRKDIVGKCDPENYERVKKKLNGRELEGIDEISPEDQVELLIREATNEWNLCRMYVGWKPLW
jgi:phosphatidylinositol kinase/protein kinase (PI-3  family)